MEKVISLKKTRFVVKEVVVKDLFLDGISCESLSLVVDDSGAGKLTLVFSLNDKSTSASKNEDIEEMRENLDYFEFVRMQEVFIISKIYRELKENPHWKDFSRFLRFVCESFDRTFRVRFHTNGKTHLRIINRDSIY